jgi:hypothetical protein
MRWSGRARWLRCRSRTDPNRLVDPTPRYGRATGRRPLCPGPDPLPPPAPPPGPLLPRTLGTNLFRFVPSVPRNGEVGVAGVGRGGARVRVRWGDLPASSRMIDRGAASSSHPTVRMAVRVGLALYRAPVKRHDRTGPNHVFPTGGSDPPGNASCRQQAASNPTTARRTR